MRPQYLDAASHNGTFSELSLRNGCYQTQQSSQMLSKMEFVSSGGRTIARVKITMY